MTAALPPFTGVRPYCAKCGHQGAIVRYTAAGDACGLMSRLSAVDSEERLCRQCEQCGFHWDEATYVSKPLEPMTEYGARIQLADFERFLGVNGFRLLGMTGGAVYVKAIVPDASCSVAGEETEPNNQAPIPLTERGETRCLSRWRPGDGEVVQCVRPHMHEGIHHDEVKRLLPTFQWTTGDQL